jgi:hypothetical protein
MKIGVKIWNTKVERKNEKIKREKVLALKRAVSVSAIPGRGLSTFSKKQIRGFNYPLTIRSSRLFILLG